MGLTLSTYDISKVGILGLKGPGKDLVVFLTQNLFPHGVQITAVDRDATVMESASSHLAKKIAAAVEKRAVREDQQDSLIANVIFSTAIESLDESDLVIEMYETEEEKVRALSEISGLIGESDILLSHSPYLEPDRLVEGLSHPERFAVVHHLLPADRNQVVEIVPGAKTSPRLCIFLESFYEMLGKAPHTVGSRFGHAVSPIAWGILQAALSLVEQGEATTKQIDAIAAKVLKCRKGIPALVQSCGGFEAAKEGLTEAGNRNIDFLKIPCLLEAQAWQSPGKDEEVSCSEETAEKIGDVLAGALCSLATRQVADQQAGIGQMEEMVEMGFGIIPPFSLMNKFKTEKIKDGVESYRQVNASFKVPSDLNDFMTTGEAWRIPYVTRVDRDGIAVVTIRRPRVLNALNSRVLDQLNDIFSAIATDASVKAVVLTGFGTKAFVAGADIKELAMMQTPEDGYQVARKGQGVFSKIENLDKPVVCAMNGLAFGGGNELAMSCHVRLAKKRQKVFVSQPEPKLGLIPGYGGTQRLPRLIGLENAWPLLRTGSIISSDKAKEVGLVREDVEGDLKENAIRLAAKLAEGSETYQPIERNPIPVPDTFPEVDLGHLSTKIDEIMVDAISNGAAKTLEEGLEEEARGFGKCVATKDTRIGLENFMKNGPRVNADFVNE